MELRRRTNRDVGFLRQLYAAAFPVSERKPFSLLLKAEKKGRMDIFIITEGEKRLGLAITIPGTGAVLLDYFAVLPAGRGQGIGSQALALLLKQYPDKPLFLEIEALDASCANLRQRQSRKAFYLRNGLHDTGHRIELFGVPMELLSSEQGLTWAECRRLYRSFYGPALACVRYLGRTPAESTGFLGF